MNLEIPKSQRPTISILFGMIAIVSLTFAGYGKIQTVAAQEAANAVAPIHAELDAHKALDVERQADIARRLERIESKLDATLTHAR